MSPLPTKKPTHGLYAGNSIIHHIRRCFIALNSVLLFHIISWAEEIYSHFKAIYYSVKKRWFLKFLPALALTAILFLPTTSFAGKRYAVATGNWNATATWSASSGGSSGASIPSGTDTVYISESSVTYTVTIPSAYSAACSAIFIGNSSNGAPATLTLAASTSSFTVNSVTIYAPTANATRTIDVNAGSMTVNGDVSLSDGIGGNQQTKVSRIYVTTGTATVAGNVIFNGNSNGQSTIDLSGGAGSGILNIGGNLTLINNSGTLTPGATSKLVFIGTGNQTLPLVTGNAISYSNIEVNKASGSVLLTGNTVITGSVTLTQGTLSTNGFLIYELGDWINNGGTMAYNGATDGVWFLGAAKTISGTSSTTFPALTIFPGASVTIQNSNSCTSLQLPGSTSAASLTHTSTGNLTVNGDVTISQPAGAVTNAWNINAGSATVTGNINIGGALAFSTWISKIAITTGTLNAYNIVFNSAASTPGTAVIDMSGGAGLMNLTGNITLTNNSGTLTPGTTGTVNFNGTAAQTISFPSAIRFNNVYTNNAAGVTAGTAITSTLLSGDIRVQTGIFNNGGFAIAGAAAKTFEVANGATFNLSATSVMVTGFGTKTFGASSTTNYNGTSQTISSETYGHLTFSGSGTKTMPASAMTIVGNFTTAGTIVTTAANALTIGGNVTLGSGTTVNAGAFTHYVAGNWTNNGATFTPSTSTINFNGTSNQNISSTTAFNNINVNKASGAITLSTDLTVTGLTFTKGLITTGAYNVIIPSTGSITGASQTTGWVNGNLQRYFSSSLLGNSYNVGGSNYYSPLTLTFAGVSAAGGITVGFSETAHPNVSASTILASKNIPDYWSITNSGSVAFTSYSVSLNWNSLQNYSGLNPSLLKVAQYSASSWTLSAVSGTPTTTNVQASGITTFGDFIAGETCTAGYWTGTVSTDWNVGGNWECGTVPGSLTDIIVSAGLFNYPVISAIAPQINNLTLQSGASITIINGTLKIAGAGTTSGGGINATGGKVEFNGSTAQTIPANLFTSNTVKDLVVTNAAGVTLGGSLRVTNTVGFGNVNNSVLTSNGYLTIASSSSNTANVSDVTNGGTNTGNNISGNVTVERYVQGKRAYRFLTAPVNSTGSIKANWMENTNNPGISVNNNPVPNYGTHITGTGGSTNGFDVTGTNNPSLFSFNGSTQAWAAAPNTSSPVSAGSGYRIMVRGSRSVNLNDNNAAPSNTTLRATGALVTGTVTMAAAGGTPGMPTLSSVTGAYNFIANPYASVVDWLLLNKTDVSSTIYIFDPTVSGSNGRGAYVAYNGTLNINNVANSSINNDIQSGQAFFVQTMGPNPSITFKEQNKSTGFLPVFRRATNPLPNLSVELMLPSQTATSADGTRVYFSEDFKSAIGEEDSYKFTNLDENIAVLKNATPLSIEGRKPIYGSDTVQLKVWQLSQSKYTLKVAFEKFPDNVEAYLEDSYLHTTTPLNTYGETLVPFGITTDAASKDPNRFKVVFESLATLPVRLTGIKAYAKNKGTEVDWATESESNMGLYEIERSSDAQTFKTVGSTKAKNNPDIASAYTFFDANPVKGTNYYRIKSVEKSGDVKFSEVVKVLISTEKNNTISVVNNPVQGNSIKLLFDNAEKGNYVVSLINDAGKNVYTGRISFAGGISYQQVDLGTHLPVGVYQLQLNNGISNKTISVLMQ